MKLKYCLLFIIVLFSLCSQAQLIKPIPGYGYDWTRGVFDSVLAIPRGLGTLRSVTIPNSTQIRYNPTDSSLYVWSGSRWLRQISVSSSGGDSSGIWEPVITAPRTQRKYWTGYKTWGSLITDSVNETVTNQYFTQARARASISVQSPLLYNSTTGLLRIDTTNLGSNLIFSGGIIRSGNLVTALSDNALWNAKKIQGYDVIPTQPGNGQTLVFNSATQRYEFANFSFTNPPNPFSAISDTIKHPYTVVLAIDDADSGKIKKALAINRGLDTIYVETDTTIRGVYGDGRQSVLRLKKDSTLGVISFTKNAGKDSTILLLGNGSRYAVKDSSGAGGGSGGSVTNVTATAPLSITGTPTATPNVVADTSKSTGRLATFSDVALKLNKTDTANNWVSNVTKINDSTIRVFKGSGNNDLLIRGNVSGGNVGNYFVRSGDSTAYTWYPNQTIYTAPPVNGIKEFDSSGRLYVRTSLNKTYSFSTSNITAGTSVIDSLPNYSGTFLFRGDSTTYYPYASNPKGYADSLRRVGLNVARRVNGTWINQYTDSVGSGGGTSTDTTSLPIYKRQGVVLPATTTADQTNTYESSVFREPGALVLTGLLSTDTVFKMWYTSGWATPNLNYAESLDGITWTKYSGNPIITNHCRSSIVKNGSTYVLYAALNTVGTQIDRYTSSNGLSWTLANSAVITTGSAGTWNVNGVHNSHVIIEGGTWKMLLDGFKTGTGYTVGYYTSSDGITWTQYASNPVLSATAIASSATGLGGSFFIKVGSIYYLWLQSTGTGTGGSVTLPSDIYKFYSTDLINWTRVGMVFQRGTADEGVNTLVGQVADPYLIQVGNKTYFYYEGSSNGGAQSGALTIKLAIAEKPLSSLVITNEGEESSIRPGGFAQQIEFNNYNMHGSSPRLQWNMFDNILGLGNSTNTNISQIRSRVVSASDGLQFTTGGQTQNFYMNNDGSFQAPSITTASGGNITALGGSFISSGSTAGSFNRANTAALSRLAFTTTSGTGSHYLGYRGGSNYTWYFDGIGAAARWYMASSTAGLGAATPDNSGSVLTIAGNPTTNPMGITIPMMATTQRDLIPLTTTVLTNLNLLTGGAAYTSVPTVSFSGGTGTATATATLSGNTITALTLGTSSGYTAGDIVTVSITGGGGSGATATVQVGQVGTTIFNTTTQRLNYYTNKGWQEDVVSGQTIGSWQSIVTTTKAMVAGEGYITTSSANAQLVYTLPASPTVGQVFSVSGGSSTGGWRISQNASQTIKVGGNTTTAGTGGYLQSATQRDAVTLLYTDTNTFTAITVVGSPTAN